MMKRVKNAVAGGGAERRRALPLLEQRFKTVVEISSGFYWEQDQRFRFTLMTGPLLEQSGVDSRLLIGKTLWEMDRLVPVSGDGAWDEHRAVLDAHLPFNDFVYKFVDAYGELRYVSTSGHPMFDERGRFSGYRGIAKDVSTRIQLERRAAVEHGVTRILADTNSVAETAIAIIRTVCETLGWACGARWEFDDDSRVLHCREGWGAPAPGVEEFLAAGRRLSPLTVDGQGLVRRTCTTGEPHWIRNVGKDPAFMRASEARRAGFRSAFAFPIMAGARIIGAMEFFSRERPHEAEVELIKSAANLGRSFGQFIQRKKTEEELLRFRMAMDFSSDHVYLVDRETMRFVDVNERACRVTGYTREELLKRGPMDVLEGNREEFERTYDELIANSPKASRSDIVGRSKNGRRGFYELQRRALRVGDRWIIATISRDVTLGRQAEEALRASEEKYRTILEGIEDAYYEVDLKGDLVFFNAAFCRMLGYTEQELKGMNNRRYQMPQVAAKVFKTFNQVYRTGVPTDAYDWEMVRRDGSTMLAEGSVHLIKDAAGTPIGFRGMLRDVTARRHMELALRDSEMRFRALTDLSSDWYWEQDVEFRFARIEGRDGKIEDSATRKLLLGKRSWETDLEIDAEGGWEAHRASAEAHQPYRDVVMHLMLSDGRRYISMSGEPVFDKDGSFSGYRGVAREITQQKRAEERVQYLATHDGLTGLPNREMFGELLNLAIQSSQRYRRKFAVLFIDLDRFKIINDTLGHEAGDILLTEMAGRLSQCLRTSDVVARLGGDEFVVLLQEVDEPAQVAAAARKILSTVLKPVMVMEQECRVTASIGICMYPTDATDDHSVMKHADIAMYIAKERGKNNFQFYSEDSKPQSIERLMLEAHLRRALERDELSLHFQAKVNLSTDGITGVEALLRWQHPSLGMVSPAQFIPLAEETGLIVPIGKWVLETACAQAVAWQRQGLPSVSLAINLSARQFTDENLLNDIAAALAETGLAPTLLELEITEGMVMQNADRAVKLLAAIKHMGVRLAIDDFGTGYSSLAQLKRFPIDTLKIDRSFIREIPQDAEDQAITKAIIAMGKTLGLTVVAEGVETEAQAQFLRAHACDEMQGYYFSRPIVPEQFAELLRTHVPALKG